MRVVYDIAARPIYLLLLPLVFCLITIFLQPRPLRAEEADITDFTVSNSNDQLTLYLTVTECFTEDMITAVHNGIPITFTYYVDVFQIRSNWLDKKIRAYEFSHTLEYDSLKKEYTIRREEKNNNRSTDSLEEAKLLMAEINGFRLMPIEEIAPGTSYVIKAKAKLARKSLPLYFHYLVPFTSLWDFETDWHQLTLRLNL